MAVTPAIPASQIVSVVPSVLAAGGDALDLIGIILTQNTRPPIGQVLEFVTAADVTSFFGTGTQESALASVYFLGFDNSQRKPGKLLFSQYAETNVNAYLRGGNVSAYTLTTLRAINGTLSIVIDSVTKSGSINLSAATSFSNAAEIIGNDLSIEGVPIANVTGSIGGTFGTCTTTGTTLTLGSVTHGYLSVGDGVSGTDATNSLPAGCHILAQLTGTPGGSAGATFTISAAATPGDMGSATVTSTSTIMDVSAVAGGSGLLVAGDVIAGTGITSGTYIVSQASGTTGGVGFYNLSGAAQTANSGIAGTVTVNLGGVTYDSIAGAFVVSSSTTGATSTMAFATGGTAASLKLTQATGGVLSQGAVAYAPGGALDAITAITQDWASFMTTWEPADDDKVAFATWCNGQGNRFMYCMIDTSITDTETGGPSSPVATIVQNNYSGIAMIYEDPNVDTVGGELAAFLMGYAASLDFTQTQGRATAAFKSQTGLAPQVFNGTVANYLKGYGLNFYGDYTTANEAFTWFYPGQITGPFLWVDSYIDQIWLNNQLQLALMVLLQNTRSIPYNQQGYGLIEAACLDPISQAVNAGVIQPGITLSNAQKAEINVSAGANVAGVVQQRGWYLQIKDAIPQVRAARQSPPMTLWYTDGQSISQIVLNSIEVQ